MAPSTQRVGAEMQDAFRLKLLACDIALEQPYPTPLHRQCSLLAVSSKHGYAVWAASFRVCQLTDLQDILFADKADRRTVDFRAISIDTPSTISHVTLDSSEEHICIAAGNTIWSYRAIQCLAKDKTPQPAASVGVGMSDILEAVVCCSDTANKLAVLNSAGEVYTVTLSSPVQPELVTTGATAMCWHWGQSCIVSSNDTGEIMIPSRSKVFDRPELDDAFQDAKVISLHTVSANEVLAVYEVSRDEMQVVVLNMQSNEYSYTAFDSLLYSSFTSEREANVFACALRDWPTTNPSTMILASASSTETMVISSKASSDWEAWEFDDSDKAVMPTRDVDEQEAVDLTPVGMALDFTSTRSLPPLNPEASPAPVPPSPILLVLTDGGVLCAWSCLHTGALEAGQAYPFMVQPKPLQERAAAAPFAMPAAPIQSAPPLALFKAPAAGAAPVSAFKLPQADALSKPTTQLQDVKKSFAFGAAGTPATTPQPGASPAIPTPKQAFNFGTPTAQTGSALAFGAPAAQIAPSPLPFSANKQPAATPAPPPSAPQPPLVPPSLTSKPPAFSMPPVTPVATARKEEPSKPVTPLVKLSKENALANCFNTLSTAFNQDLVELRDIDGQLSKSLQEDLVDDEAARFTQLDDINSRITQLRESMDPRTKETTATLANVTVLLSEIKKAQEKQDEIKRMCDGDHANDSQQLGAEQRAHKQRMEASVKLAQTNVKHVESTLLQLWRQAQEAKHGNAPAAQPKAVSIYKTLHSMSNSIGNQRAQIEQLSQALGKLDLLEADGDDDGQAASEQQDDGARKRRQAFRKKLLSAFGDVHRPVRRTKDPQDIAKPPPPPTFADVASPKVTASQSPPRAPAVPTFPATTQAPFVPQAAPIDGPTVKPADTSAPKTLFTANTALSPAQFSFAKPQAAPFSFAGFGTATTAAAPPAPSTTTAKPAAAPTPSFGGLAFGTAATKPAFASAVPAQPAATPAPPAAVSDDAEGEILDDSDVSSEYDEISEEDLKPEDGSVFARLGKRDHSPGSGGQQVSDGDSRYSASDAEQQSYSEDEQEQSGDDQEQSGDDQDAGERSDEPADEKQPSPTPPPRTKSPAAAASTSTPAAAVTQPPPKSPVVVAPQAETVPAASAPSQPSAPPAALVTATSLPSSDAASDMMEEEEAAGPEPKKNFGSSFGGFSLGAPTAPTTTNASPFGVPASTTAPAFGAPAPFGGFGAAAATTSAFGSAVATSATNPFATASSTPSATRPFGAFGTAPSGNAFASPAPAAAPAFGSAGSTPSSAFGARPPTATFGSPSTLTSPLSGFGQPSVLGAGAAFGTPSRLGFGGASAAAPASGFGARSAFGAGSAAPSGFGGFASAAAATAGGGATSAFGAARPTGFAAFASPNAASQSPFGQAAAPGGFGMGVTPPKPPQFQGDAFTQMR
ncbi:hypothetical protein RI367_002184 [Sorochytrium milnesiophthora]